MDNQIKISTFSPLIITKKPEKTVRMFQKLGFEVRHAKELDDGIFNATLKDANGNQIDIREAGSKEDKDMTIIRMNVPDFDAAYELLQEDDFKIKGGHITETESSKSAMVVSPTGFAFDLCEHIKKQK